MLQSGLGYGKKGWLICPNTTVTITLKGVGFFMSLCVVFLRDEGSSPFFHLPCDSIFKSNLMVLILSFFGGGGGGIIKKKIK